ncbi:DMT family transporter [Janibacter massiliensis]|uniref:DMT family transporter n=1 Tax=Janibacter massiliensis TaxID=2058291 RepID=UPI000D0FB978|nr:DMT family transporter [Janibacter massiliensis]
MTRRTGADERGRSELAATGLLVAVTAVWGSTFFLIRDLVRVVPSADFLTVRFAIAAIAVALVLHRPVRALTRRDVLVGIGLGALYGAAQLLQTVGLEHTSASVSGFITGMYVVLTPAITALLLRERIEASTWIAVALSTAGLAILSLRGVSVGAGEALTLGSAVVYALHIIALGRWSTPERAVGLAVVQSATIAIVCLPFAAPGGITLPRDGGQWAALVYMALAAGAGALLAQTWAQAHLSATRAAVVMTLEPVFAALFAVLLGGESATARMLLGGALVLAAMYVAELAGRSSTTPAVEDPPSEALHHDA